jgi:2-hydroxyglutarate dehydrogenase
LLNYIKFTAAHQSGHNSGVIHAGIYYTPGTLKAKLCVEGFKMSYKYFDQKNIPYKRCGKLIVATNSIEVKRLDDIMRKGIENDVPGLEMVDSAKIREIEPYCKVIIQLLNLAISYLLIIALL